jgi:hypothetical protein
VNITVFCEITSSSLVQTYDVSVQFGTSILHFIFYPEESSDVCIFFREDGDSTSFLNVRKFIVLLGVKFLKTANFNYA